MISINKRNLELSVAVLIGAIPAFLLAVVFDAQVPKSLSHDIDARLYPNTLAILWLIVSGLHIVETLKQSSDEYVVLEGTAIKHVVLILATAWIGFVVSAYVGYLVAGSIVIFGLAQIAKERVWVAGWVAIVFPIGCYVFLYAVLDVRLPTILDHFR